MCRCFSPALFILFRLPPSLLLLHNLPQTFKHGYLIDTIVNQALTSLQEGSLEITLQAILDSLKKIMGCQT